MDGQSLVESRRKYTYRGGNSVSNSVVLSEVDMRTHHLILGQMLKRFTKLNSTLLTVFFL